MPRPTPATVTYGTTGIGSDDHLAALMFERAAGVKMTHVPFKGAAEVHNAIASKQIMVAAMNIGEALQYQKGGTPLRHLGQMSEKRSTLAPNVPTFKEQGFNVIMASLRGMAAPKGLPPAVREQLVERPAEGRGGPGVPGEGGGLLRSAALPRSIGLCSGTEGRRGGVQEVVADDALDRQVSRMARDSMALPARLGHILCLDDFEAAARRHLPAPVFAYVSGGVERNQSLRANARAFEHYEFVTRVLVDTSKRSTETTLFGTDLVGPVRHRADGHLRAVGLPRRPGPGECGRARERADDHERLVADSHGRDRRRPTRRPGSRPTYPARRRRSSR